MLHIDPWQLVIVDFVNRIFQLCKQENSESKWHRLRTGRRTRSNVEALWILYIHRYPCTGKMGLSQSDLERGQQVSSGGWLQRRYIDKPLEGLPLSLCLCLLWNCTSLNFCIWTAWIAYYFLILIFKIIPITLKNQLPHLSYNNLNILFEVDELKLINLEIVNFVKISLN